MTEKIIKIDELFPDGKTVSALKITEYLDWAAHPDEYSQVLAMPPIQRGFVWKPKQIQDLWDSLLRGMPIGSVLLKAMDKGESSAELQAVYRKYGKSSKSGFQLMDGQQRTLAMLLGFPSKIKTQHKLWIDFSEPGKGGSQFQFRVSTEAQPFGFSTDGARLSLDDRRKARNSWDREDEERKQKSNQEIFNDETTRPWKAGANKQEYLFEVKVVWEWLLKDQETLERVKTIIKNKINKSDIDENIFNRIDAFRLALMALQNQWLALIKIPEVKKQDLIEDPSHDYLTMLFDRISSGGTRLSPDDLLFSMIKQSWPDAHNIVNNLHEKVGSLMKPTDFVMTAFRLAALQSSEIKGDPELNAKTFHKHLFDLLGSENDDSKILRKMIKEDGPLVKAFEQLIALIKYSGGDSDSGIPSAMLPYMNVSMLQVVLYWLLHQESAVDFHASRDEILRFIMFWFVCNKDARSSYEASKVAIQKIKSDPSELFPAKSIYQELTRKDDYGWSFPPLITPPKVSFDSDKFRKQNEREVEFFGKDNALLYGNFTARKILLLWLQRKWIEQKFHPQGHFKFLAGQDEDNVPYDLDHLVPQSNWSSLRGIFVKEIQNKENYKVFTDDIYHRRALGNSIGNYRVMDSSENRSRRDMPLAGSDKNPQEKGFLEHHDQWCNYAFNPNINEVEKWKIASPKEKNEIWDDKRLLAFQYAIESRVMHLYNRFHDELEFSTWLTAETKH